MRHHLIVAVEAAVVEIRRVEIGVAQRRRLEKTARANVMLLVIDEDAGGNMTAGAAQARIVRKRLHEQRFAATLQFADLSDQSAAGTKAGIGQEVDILDIGDDGIEGNRGRFRPGKLVDDNVVDEIAQRWHPAVVAIGRKIACAAQARDPAPDRAPDCPPSD